MRRKNLLFLIPCLICGCTAPSASSLSSPLSLQKKLEDTKKQKQTIEKKIVDLEIALAQEEIARIRKAVKAFDPDTDKLEDYAHFELQREKLAAIIQTVPLCAADAQGALDQILSLITHLKTGENKI